MNLTRPIVLASLLFLPLTARAEADLSLSESPGGYKIHIGESLFAEYLTASNGQPVVWPIIGPTGAPYTRAYPVGPRGENEATDHPHHQSLWFSHGEVNGYDFWANKLQEEACEIVHREFVRAESDGKTATLVTRNDWMVEGEQQQCEDQRTLVFGADEDTRWIDFTVKLISPTHEVHFGDTKEGTFAIRVAASMKVDEPGQGRIINNRGQENGKTWGQPAEWVDYYGPVNGETGGIAIFSHPDNVQHPCKWHVRNYGLFAANPFGEHHFAKSDVTQGEVILKPGEELTLRYRAVFHRGDAESANIEQRFEAFAADRAPESENP